MGAYAWQLYGFWIGVGSGILYIIINIAINLGYMAISAKWDSERDWVKDLQRIKWLLFIIGMVLVPFSGA